jgi:HlyD family type I secretion membrane fusion protein
MKVQHQSTLPKARARFLAQAMQLEEQGVDEIIRAAVYFTLALFVAAIIWASVTEVNEVTVAKGEVVPKGYIHNIQHLEGGLVSDILVRNGDRVTKGQLLIKFAAPASQPDYEQLAIRQASLKLKLARIAAIKQQQSPDFGAMGKQYPELAAKEQASYQAQIRSNANEKAVLQSQIKQRQTELNKQQNRVLSLQKEISLLQKQVSMREHLSKRNLVSKTELLDMKSRLANLESQRRSAQDNIAVARAAISEATYRLNEFDSQLQKENEFEVAEITEQLAEIAKSLVKARDKVERLNVYAPIEGIVQGLRINSINTVIKPGEIILKLVPLNDKLLVEAKIMPEEIGHIHIGQPTEVRVDSYDATRFGFINGEVSQISPSTYLDERREPYYLSRIELEKNYVGDIPGQMKIIPGMTVKVNMITGSKTIMAYLLKPVTRGFSNAFQER